MFKYALMLSLAIVATSLIAVSARDPTPCALSYNVCHEPTTGAFRKCLEHPIPTTEQTTYTFGDFNVSIGKLEGEPFPPEFFIGLEGEEEDDEGEEGEEEDPEANIPLGQKSRWCACLQVSAQCMFSRLKHCPTDNAIPTTVKEVSKACVKRCTANYACCLPENWLDLDKDAAPPAMELCP